PEAVAEAERRRDAERRQAEARAAEEAEAARRAEQERIAAAERRQRAEAEEAARAAEEARLAEARRVAEARRIADAEAAPPPSRTVDLTGSFRTNRGRLPWPAFGTVTGRFGTRTDPVSGTRISSPGIDISTAPGAPAVSVFEGVVQRVGRIPTYGRYVMVTHGEFVTLYGNLSQVSVRQGQTVRAGQAIGRSGTAAERRGAALFFALYQGGSPSDPTGWLESR
ncbi:murein hydrolase activator EnvC family protein, partial [Rubrivirga sp.]|uniref:murein hydrolase activator EnvC family protein n=1 Tax=Rubrivirga sp. TaxID=1885344 RepID=UPI003C782FEF